MIHENLNEQLKDAMRAKNKTRLAVIRDLKSAFTNELVAFGKMPSDTLDDETALKVIKRKASQRKDSIEQFEKAGRDELADKEKAELALLEEYLPEELPDEEIQKVIDAKKAELGILEKKDLGRLIGAVMREVSGQADGGRVKALVEASF